MLPFRSTRQALPVLLAACLASGCSTFASSPGNDQPVEPPADTERGDSTLEALSDRFERELQAERERVDGFGDLPDAADVGSPARGPGPAAEEPTVQAPGVVTERARLERRNAFNPYVLTAHRQNFILPAYGTTSLNESVYVEDGTGYTDLQPVELRFQLSLKAQLNGRDMLLKDDSLWFGLTLEAWWQVYNASDSRPFRETNYTPEFFYQKPLLWGPFGGSTTWLLGISHQSNGQQVGLSRSWNRVYTGLIYERGNFVLRLRPWYRIPEDRKDRPDDPRGDDNPDIRDFLGHGDLSVYWRHRTREYGMLLRANTATGKGAVQLSYTFPFTERFRGLVQYFAGYGESLIDYDHFQQRLGVGIALTDLN